MSRLDLQPPALTVAGVSHPDPRPERHLIVLVPELETYPVDAARRIWELAKAGGCRVRFLGLTRQAAGEPGLRREIVTMSAMVRNENIEAEARVEVGSNWLTAIRSEFRDGDVIVCLARQPGGLFERPLHDVLQSSLGASVYILSDLSPVRSRRSNWPSRFAVWTGSLGLIVGFAFMQIRIASLPNDWVQTTLFLLSITAEAWFIWAWNSLFD